MIVRRFTTLEDLHEAQFSCETLGLRWEVYTHEYQQEVKDPFSGPLSELLRAMFPKVQNVREFVLRVLEDEDEESSGDSSPEDASEGGEESETIPPVPEGGVV